MARHGLGTLSPEEFDRTTGQVTWLKVLEQKQYDQLKVQRDAMFKRSLPYLEKAHQLDKRDMDTMTALKELYARLNMMDKLEEIKKEIDAAKG